MKELQKAIPDLSILNDFEQRLEEAVYDIAGASGRFLPKKEADRFQSEIRFAYRARQVKAMDRLREIRQWIVPNLMARLERAEGRKRNTLGRGAWQFRIGEWFK